MQDQTDPLLRLPEIIGRPATANSPAVRALIPVGRTTWWAGVKSGRFPKPVRIGARCIAWRSSDIARAIEQMPLANTGGG